MWTKIADFFKDLNVDQFMESLEYMWQGMLCIFIVIGAIMASVYAMGAISTASAKKKAEKEKQD